MSMKKTLAASILVAAISTAAVSAASAAAAKPAAKPAAAKPAAKPIAVVNGSFIINGQTSSIRTISFQGATLVSVRDVAALLGAETSFSAGGRASVKLNDTTVDLKSNSDQALVNGTALTLSHKLVNVKGTTFIDGQAFLEAFGLAVTAEGGILSVDTRKLLEMADDARWVNADWLVVSKLTDTGRTDYLVNAKTGDFSELLKSVDSSDLTISPDGKKAAYSDGDGIVNVIDLATKQATAVSKDNSIKSELQWSADGASLYFLQGDKNTVIAKMNVADGTVTKVMDDKIDYKANLSVSADGQKFAYTVSKTGTVKADDKKPVDADDVTIDMTGTEPQVYLFDASVKDGKPVQVTTTGDDKVDVIFADGKAFYVSAATDTNILSGLVSIDASKKLNSVFIEEDVLQAEFSNGKIYVLSAAANGTQHIYAIDPATGAKTLVANVPDTVSEIVINGSSIAVFDDGAVKVQAEGKWVAVTK